MSDGARLPSRFWPAVSLTGKETQPRAIVIGVHGMNDYSGAFDSPARFLAHDGIATYAFDQRCFGAAPHRGKWAGTSTMVQDLDEVSALVHAQNPGVPIYLVGLSMGSAVILAAAGGNQLPHADGVILVSPAVWGWSEMNFFYRLTLWLGAHTVPNKKLSGEDLSTHPSDNIEMLHGLEGDPLMMKDSSIGAIYGLVSLMNRGYHGAASLKVPTLVLYGKKDQLVPEAAVRDMANRIPAEKRFLIYAYGYHMLERDYQADIVLQDIETWIGNRAAPMGSVGVPADHPWEEEVVFSRSASASMR